MIRRYKVSYAAVHHRQSLQRETQGHVVGLLLGGHCPYSLAVSCSVCAVVGIVWTGECA